MIYNDFKGKKLSMLGMGTMRLPTSGNDGRIDENAAQVLIDKAIAGGVNYFDTAYGYHGGCSEPFVGKALEKYPRESFYLATKFPGYDVSNFGKAEEIFEKQLSRCRVSYFDFYLLHNLCEMNIEQYLNDEKYGTVSFFKKQKAEGRIKHLGCSMHASLDAMKRFLNVYGKDMEFCQIQLNYLDYTFQNAKEKIKILSDYNIPIWVMEPVRGGKLIKLPEADTEKLKEMRPDESVASWAFRFVQDIPNVKVILSGMSDEEQIADNLRTFSGRMPLSEKETSLLFSIANGLTKRTSIPCTSCRYCTSHCPKGLDIPRLIELYNEKCFSGSDDSAFIAPMVLSSFPTDKRPDACIACHSCEAVCPQQINISSVMKDFRERVVKK